MANNILLGKIANEGYCCIRGYLDLCATRKERVVDMAKFLDIMPSVVWFHRRKLASGECLCQKQKDCMQPLIKEIKENP